MEKQITLDTVFDEVNQDGEWRNALAKQLNILLARARYFHETSNDESDKEAEQATLAVVERVSAFEEVLVQPQSEIATEKTKVLEIRILLPDSVSTESLEEYGEEAQNTLPVDFEQMGMNVLDVTFEVTTVSKAA